ncbi:hypothetical protein BH11BAC1_BH11BAC1_16940 [soil metagenome]
MKKIFLALFVCSSIFAKAQIICIFCYDQSDSISDNVNNLLLNGGFENGCGNFGYFCPNSGSYSCNLSNWTCSGGGTSTYACTYDSSVHASTTPEGKNVAYFGNGVFTRACSAAMYDTSCMADSGCTALNIQPGYPFTDSVYGGGNGVMLSQTVNGLTIGNTYILEFWAGGEGQSAGWMKRGLFGVDVGFGNTFLRNYPTNPGYSGTRFIIEFNAISTSHVIKFTSWGHICGICTELMLDDARLYTVAELSPIVPPCAGATLTALFTAPNHICPGTCTDFTNLSTNATGFLWTFPGAIPATSTDANPLNICYSASGNYNVQLIVSNSNGSDTLLLPNYITVYPAPPPQGIIQSGDTLFANAGSSGYQWYFNGNIIPGATNDFYLAPTSGDYNVVAIDGNGCEVEAAIFDVIAEVGSPPKDGFAEANGSGESTANEVVIFPNPVGDKVRIHKLEVKNETAVEISVYNMVGEKVWNGLQESKAANHEAEINVSQLPPGIYFVELTSEDKTFRAKFVKSSYR